MNPSDDWMRALLLESLEEILTPTDEWDDYSGWGEFDDNWDPLGPDDPDDYMSEADE